MTKDNQEYNEELGVLMNDNGTCNVPMNGFPMHLFLEWNNHCKVRHNDKRWAKAYDDHEKARKYEILMKAMAQSGVGMMMPPNEAESMEGKIDRQNIGEENQEDNDNVKLYR